MAGSSSAAAAVQVQLRESYVYVIINEQEAVKTASCSSKKLVGSLGQINIEPFEREFREFTFFVHFRENFVDLSKKCCGRQAGGLVECGGEIL